MEALEYVREYIDNLLVVTRGTLQDHLITKGGYQETTQNGIVQTILALNPQYMWKATAFPRHGNIVPWHVSEACEMLATLSHRGSAEKQKPQTRSNNLGTGIWFIK